MLLRGSFDSLSLSVARAVSMAQRGQVSSKIDEERLKGMLTGIEGAKKETKIKFARKTYGDDEDEDDYSDL